jgi:hypothetical protein
MYNKYDEITDQLQKFAKEISEDAATTKAEFEAILDKN